MNTWNITPEVREACAAWQGGRDSGSSPIRAAARVLTRTSHYFTADFITDLEREAAADSEAMARARVLLDAVALAPRLDPVEWCSASGAQGGWAGRGLRSAAQDSQIVEALTHGTLNMPLWGLSLDRDVASSFGTRFMFEVAGRFPAIAAWLASGLKHEEQELIAGGRYEIENVDDQADGTTLVRIRFADVLR